MASVRLLRAARCVRRGLAGVAGLVSLLAVDVQAQGSPYLPLDDIGYAYIDALVARGQLRTLSMLERPHTVGEIRRALAADTAARSGTVGDSWRAALLAAIERYDPTGGREGPAESLTIRADLAAFATARSSGFREVMAADTGGGVYPGVAGRFVASGGPIVAGLRVSMDRALKEDPEFQGKKDRSITGRVEDAYLGVALRYLDVSAGRVARNLGPHALHGLQIGHHAYTYDHLFARLGTRRFHLATLLASLDPMEIGDSVANRYVAYHRVSAAWGGVELAVSEAMLFGGVGRRFAPGYLNPLSVYQLAQYNEHESGNVSFALEGAWRTRGRGVYAAQLLIDDFQIDDCSPNCEEPPSYGVVASAEGVPLWGDQRLFASYARVSNLTYRTPADYEQWTSFGVGLGHARSDYDELRGGLDLAVAPRLTLRPYVAVRRQGEGDYRLPFPTPAEYATTPEIHAGVIERTTRVAVTGAWNPAPLVRVQGDIGWNGRSDARHVTGESDSSFEGWVRVTIESPWVVRRELLPD